VNPGKRFRKVDIGACTCTALPVCEHEGSSIYLSRRLVRRVGEVVAGQDKKVCLA
jgi:hypothetical protein